MAIVKYGSQIGGGYLPSMNGKLISHQEETFSCTWFTKWDYAVKNYYNDDVDYIPPELGSPMNSYIEFRSKTPNRCTVDWGDGNKESFSFAKVSDSIYLILFRSLNYPYRKIGLPFYSLSDGTSYEGVPPHHFDNGLQDKERSVTVVFDEPFYQCEFNTSVLSNFPIVVSSKLESLILNYTGGNISNIPYDSFKYIPNLLRLHLVAVSSNNKLKEIPSSIFDLVNLDELRIQSNFDCSDIDSCGLRNISKLKNLSSLYIGDCNIPKYIKEFNDIPNILAIDMGNNQSWDSSIDINDIPDFSEVENINPSLNILNIFNAGGTGVRTNIDLDLSGKGIDHLTYFKISYLPNLDLSYFPNYMYELRNIGEFAVSSTLRTQERADQFVDTFYDFVVNWEYITMQQEASDGIRNHFYGLVVEAYSGSISEAEENKRPSGVYQAPSGFEQGVSNGNPQTPMEKIYVLENNYSQIWTIAPEN